MRHVSRISLALILALTPTARAGLRTDIAHVLPQPSGPLSQTLDALDQTIARQTTGGWIGASTEIKMQLAHALTLLAQLQRSERDSAVQALGRAFAHQAPALAKSIAEEMASKAEYKHLRRVARNHEAVAVPTELLDIPVGFWQMGAGAVGTAALPLTVVVLIGGFIAGVAGLLMGEAAAGDLLAASADAFLATSIAEDEGKKQGFTRRAASYARGGFLRLSNRRRMVDVVRTVRPGASVATSFCAAILSET